MRILVRSLPLFLVAVLAVAPESRGQGRPPRKVAFLVGVGKYDHKFTDLGTAPDRDTSALAKVLSDGGFEVVVLSGGKPDGDPLRATRGNIESQFKALFKATADRPALRSGDTLLVALCGHGVQAEAGPQKGSQPFFCPVDAVPDDTDTMVPLNSLIRTAEPFGATTLFLVDACREIADPDRGTRSGIQGKKITLPENMAVLFSCRSGQLSHQSDKADGGHGLFTYAVLKTLKGETGRGGKISWTRIVAGVEEAFESDEFQALLPKGAKQSPVEAKGELSSTEILTVKAGGTAKVNPSAGGTVANEMAKKEARKLRPVADEAVFKALDECFKVRPAGGDVVWLGLWIGEAVDEDDLEHLKQLPATMEKEGGRLDYVTIAGKALFDEYQRTRAVGSSSNDWRKMLDAKSVNAVVFVGGLRKGLRVDLAAPPPGAHLQDEAALEGMVMFAASALRKHCLVLRTEADDFPWTPSDKLIGEAKKTNVVVWNDTRKGDDAAEFLKSIRSGKPGAGDIRKK